jgi:hypothetical protein
MSLELLSVGEVEIEWLLINYYLAFPSRISTRSQ